MSKKINEMTAMAGGSVAMSPATSNIKKKKLRLKETDFVPAPAAVYTKETELNPSYNPEDPKSRKFRRKKEKKPMPYKLAVVETQAEKTLRETIRQIIFLNKIKFYEEQAKEALQENKLRYIIRGLLSEAETKLFDTTGQNSGADALKRLKVTFDKYQKISSTTDERERFKLSYITGINTAFDSEDKSAKVVGGGLAPTQGVPATNLPPAKRKDLEEQGEEGVEASAEVPAAPSPQELVQQQATQAATAAVGLKDQESAPNEILSAIEALDRDIPQILDLYRQLSDKQITVNGRATTDKQDFKTFLIGNGTNAGNIQIEFDKIDKLSPASDAKMQPVTKPVVTSAEKPATPPLSATTPADLETPAAPEGEEIPEV